MYKTNLPDSKYATWKGLDRTIISWNPTIDEEQCIGCGLCITGCGRLVFGYDSDTDKAIVVKPANCMVGCSTCKNICPKDAITFPDKEYVQDIIKKHKLIAYARKELKEAVAQGKYILQKEKE